MNLRRLLLKLKQEQPEPVKPMLLDRDLKERVDAVLTPVPDVPKQAKGRVIKKTRHAEYDPTQRRGGGRIVKTMPRQLQKIKAAQEKVEDDDGPRIED